jgi:RHS repeat-associated protein
MPYKFNGKEKDEETGLYYYGARYYNGDDQLWMGVDPMWEKYPGISPYVYCANNPVRYNDPDGRNPVFVIGGVIFTATDLLLISTGIMTTGVIIHQTQSGGIAVNPNIKEMFGFATASTNDSRISNATASTKEGLNNQRNNGRRGKEVLDQSQANIAKSIDTNISGDMPDGNPAPKRDPNDGGKNTKVAVGVVAVGGTVRAGLELTNPNPSKDAVEAHQEKVQPPPQQQQQQQQNKPNSWDRFIKWVFE